MRRFLGIAGVVGAAAIALGALAPGASAQDATARVRVVHASPDAPAVDVYVDGSRALENVAFKGASGYISLPAGAHNFQVFAAGEGPDGTAVIDADATLEAGTDYTVIAAGTLEEIRPVVLEDDNSAPAAGKAHVRVVHASPDAPAVDVAVARGPVLFPNLSFPNAAGPAPVDAGTYDLEVRAAGTTTVALPIDDVTLEAGKIYTVLAVGLLSGTPALEALPLVTAPSPASAPTAVPATGGAPAPAATQAAPAGQLPAAGTGDASNDMGGITSVLATMAIAAMLVLGAGAVAATRRVR
jgi:hypothetical protein